MQQRTRFYLLTYRNMGTSRHQSAGGGIVPEMLKILDCLVLHAGANQAVYEN